MLALFLALSVPQVPAPRPVAVAAVAVVRARIISAARIDWRKPPAGARVQNGVIVFE